MTGTFKVERFEERFSMAVAVHISGIERALNTETTFTENVSCRGARVLSSCRWRTNEILELRSLPGDFRTGARVKYCKLQSEGFAIGLEFLEPTGRWVVRPPAVSGKPLQG